MSDTIKLSAPATREFWEIPVLYEDEHLMALNKPPLLLTSPDRYNPERPNLMKLLHSDIERGASWAKKRGLTYLFNAHRLDFETSGIILLAKNKSALVELANSFGSEKPLKIHVALVKGAFAQEELEIDAKLAPDQINLGKMRISPKEGKRSRTLVKTREAFHGFSLLECRPLTERTHQIRVHLAYMGLPILGDKLYGGPPLLLSGLKSDYRLKGNAIERPLISSTALHAEQLDILHPVTNVAVKIFAEWPKDLQVAVKYLRRHAPSKAKAID